jgi:hypothetical protein
MCISSFSPRFYFRNHAFCFLPLAAILESSPKCFFSECSHYWYALICNFLSMERGGLPSHRVPCAGDLKLCLGSTSQGGTYLTLSAPGCSPPFSCLPQHLTGFQPIWFLLYSSWMSLAHSWASENHSGFHRLFNTGMDGGTSPSLLLFVWWSVVTAITGEETYDREVEACCLLCGVVKDWCAQLGLCITAPKYLLCSQAETSGSGRSKQTLLPSESPSEPSQCLAQIGMW